MIWDNKQEPGLEPGQKGGTHMYFLLYSYIVATIFVGERYEV